MLPLLDALLPPLKISKTLKIPVLLDTGEMERLLEALGSPCFYLIQGICQEGEGVLLAKEFLTLYGEYVSSLKEGRVPETARFRTPFAAALSGAHEALYAFKVEGGHLIRASQPVVQLQWNKITYSSEDQTFRSQLFGQGGIEWGIQFSYPQLFQDSETGEVCAVDNALPNTSLFRALQKWIRYHTVATPFFVDGKRMNAPIRLGKECFSWIERHEGLRERGIGVWTR